MLDRIPEDYIHRQSYQACDSLLQICQLKCTEEQRRNNFEDAKKSIDLVLSENTKVKEFQKKLYEIMLIIIGCEDIPIQIGAFTIALLAGTIGLDKPPDYTIKVAEDILKTSGIREIAFSAKNLANSKVDPESQSDKSKKVDGFATFICNHTPFARDEKKIVSGALSSGKFVPVDVRVMVGIVFDPTREKYLVPANRVKFVKKKEIWYIKRISAMSLIRYVSMKYRVWLVFSHCWQFFWQNRKKTKEKLLMK